MLKGDGRDWTATKVSTNPSRYVVLNSVSGSLCVPTSMVQVNCFKLGIVNDVESDVVSR